MSFNISFNFSYLAQTNTFNHNGDSSDVAHLATQLISSNLKVKLYPEWYKQITVEWSIPADWGNCQFNVYYGPTETGPFEKINIVPVTGFYLSDSETQEIKRFSNGFYIVEAQLLDKANAMIRSQTTTWETSQTRWVELRAIEIQRREYLLLKKFVGIKTYLFRRKSFGQRCTECWDSISEKSIKDHCKTCIGTTFTGGYFDYVTTFMQYDATPNANVKTYAGVLEPNQVAAWTISLPEIRPDDIVIRVGDWSLYRIDHISNTELQGKTVRQMALLTQLSKLDIEYQLITKNLPDFPTNYL